MVASGLYLSIGSFYRKFHEIVLVLVVAKHDLIGGGDAGVELVFNDSVPVTDLLQ